MWKKASPYNKLQNERWKSQGSENRDRAMIELSAPAAPAAAANISMQSAIQCRPAAYFKLHNCAPCCPELIISVCSEFFPPRSDSPLFPYPQCTTRPLHTGKNERGSNGFNGFKLSRELGRSDCPVLRYDFFLHFCVEKIGVFERENRFLFCQKIPL